MSNKRITVKNFIERINEVLGIESSSFAERLAEALAKLTEEAFEITLDQARVVAEELDIEDEVDLEQFRRGLEVEMEHSAIGVEVDDVGLDLLEIGKIAYAHLKEDPEYYTKLATIHVEEGVIREQEEKPKEEEKPEEGDEEKKAPPQQKKKEEEEPEGQVEPEEQEEVKEEIQQTDLVVPEHVAKAFEGIPGPKRYDPVNQRVYFMREGIVYSAPANDPEAAEEVANEKLIKLLGFDEE